MRDQKSFPYDVLEADQSNIQITVDLLTKYGIIELYERVVPGLIAGLLPAVQKAAPEAYFPFSRSSGGIEVPTYDFILRLFMLQSAHEQYIFALGHLFRGHGSEVPGHLRRAIESAGIAYLSKSKPELGDVFMSGDPKKLRNCSHSGFSEFIYPSIRSISQYRCFYRNSRHNTVTSWINLSGVH